MKKDKFFLLFTVLVLTTLIFYSQFKNKSRTKGEFVLSFHNGSKFLNDSLVDKLLIQKLQLDKNESNLILDLREIEEFLEIQPEVLNAEVYTLPNGNIKTEILERKPVIRVLDKGFYLDENGVKIPLSKNHTYRVPIFLNSFENKNINDIIFLTKIMLNDSFFKNEFSQMWIENNQLHFRLRDFDFDILWGRNTKVNHKIKKLKAFCAYFQGDTINKTLKKIDLSIENQIVAIE